MQIGFGSDGLLVISTDESTQKIAIDDLCADHSAIKCRVSFALGFLLSSIKSNSAGFPSVENLDQLLRNIQ
jgi:hypothetical protein